MKNFAKLVKDELKSARKQHGPMNSIHEGYSVILEELDEVWDEVKKKTRERDLNHLLKELVQVSAMAQKMAEDVVMNKIYGEKR
jgi:NTP pyrophosphatase (non-canonical NTP hydrolase)